MSCSSKVEFTSGREDVRNLSLPKMLSVAKASKISDQQCNPR
jgi:hypothetical protein